MKIFMLLASWVLFNDIAAQIINPDFDDWVEIHIGQPYIDPVGWTTNNQTTEIGLASTPVDRIMDSLGFYARISSNAYGIDATLSGMMSQTIAAENLVKIEFDSKCDTLWQTGRCIVRVLDQDNMALYADTLSDAETEFSRSTIDIETNWTQTNDSLTIQFIAKGGHDMWDEEEDGYSVYMIDNVSAEYITEVEEVKQEFKLNIYPNPADNFIQINHNLPKEPTRIEIVSLIGQTAMITKYTNEINVKSLSSGVYILYLISEGMKLSTVFVVDHKY